MLNFMRHQVMMRDFALDRLYVHEEKGCGWLCDPGTGKTVTALEVLKTLLDLGEVKHALLLAPLRVADEVWPAEIEKWGYIIDWHRLGNRGARDFRRRTQLDICSRDSVHTLLPQAGRWDLLIIDEVSSFRNWGTKRMKSLRKLLPSIPRRLTLTGTPCPNSEMDLHSQAFILDDGEALGKNVSIFRRRYCRKGGWCGKKWELRDGVGESIKDAVDHLFIHISAEDYLDLPPLVVNDVWIELPEHAKKVNRQMKAELFALLESGENVTAVNAGAAYQKLRQIANGAMYDSEGNTHFVHDAKINAVQDLVDELNGKQLLLFYQFQSDLQRILKKFGKCPVVGGKVPPKETKKNIADWLANKHQILAVQVQAGSHGLNLQTGGCHHVAFMGLSDSSETYDQAYRRVYRNGVNERVFVHRFLCQDTVDRVICDRVDGKLGNQRAFLNALRKWSGDVK